MSAGARLIRLPAQGDILHVGKTSAVGAEVHFWHMVLALAQDFKSQIFGNYTMFIQKIHNFSQLSPRPS
jgi:hypothetical protein